jgi:hypothetical protein
VGVFAEKGFPVIDGMTVSREDLERAFDGWDVQFLPLSALIENLTAESVDLLVTPHGSAFPKPAWETILRYLSSGGSWLNLGGTPFAVPVRREGSAWHAEAPNPNSHKRIGITQSFAVTPDAVARYAGNKLVDGSAALVAECTVSKVHELYVRFTSAVDFPSESGTSGPRDALLRPLFWGLSGSERPLVAPVVLIDRMQGEFAGGRWVFAAFEGSISPKGIRLLSELALEDSLSRGATDPANPVAQAARFCRVLCCRSL